MSVRGLGVGLGCAALFGRAPSIFARCQGSVRREPMAKQGNTQSRGSGKAGAEITTEQGLERVLEPLLLVLEDGARETVVAAGEAIGQILCSGGIDATQVGALVEAEDVLDRVGRALEQASVAICGSGA